MAVLLKSSTAAPGWRGLRSSPRFRLELAEAYPYMRKQKEITLGRWIDSKGEAVRNGASCLLARCISHTPMKLLNYQKQMGLTTNSCGEISAGSGVLRKAKSSIRRGCTVEGLTAGRTGKRSPCQQFSPRGPPALPVAWGGGPGIKIIVAISSLSLLWRCVRRSPGRRCASIPVPAPGRAL